MDRTKFEKCVALNWVEFIVELLDVTLDVALFCPELVVRDELLVIEVVRSVF
jgi:hypothetical protein